MICLWTLGEPSFVEQLFIDDIYASNDFWGKGQDSSTINCWYHISASTIPTKEEGMPKPSMPLQLDRGHNPPSMEAATAVVMITV